MAILIGVAGGTGSGKTSFARKLVEAIGEESCLMVPQDSYYRDTSSLTAEERARWNYDHPHAFDTSLLEQDLRELKMSRPVPHLTYDYATHARIVQPDALRPRPVIVLEGILVLAEESLRRIMDIRLFIDTDADVRILRRLRRDLKERGRSYD
ncbi:MAG: uridine kinase, partial [Vicinamibacteria bacterium]|nr:uridine kinase [Vicinamibacteria bacterium]